VQAAKIQRPADRWLRCCDRIVWLRVDPGARRGPEPPVSVQVVLGHWGEMLLFWLDRADSLSLVAGLQRSVSDYIRTNFFITASGMLNPALLTTLCR
jgi:predicted TIM-barrel fold metal-dependent hydrolase